MMKMHTGQSKTDEDFLDITSDVCPMTFVRTKLRLERLAPGAVLTVLLKGGEPLSNVPRAAAELGHAVLDIASQPDGTHRLRIRRA